MMIDPDTKGLWFLSGIVDASGVQIDPRLFTCCTRYNYRGNITISVGNTGSESLFNFGAFGMLISECGLNAALESQLHANLQRIPVTVSGAKHNYEILNVLDCIDCIDETKSALSRWREEDGRPDRIGQYKMVYELVVDPTKASKYHLFRVSGWSTALICSDIARSLLEQRGVAGIVFQSVM